MISHHLVVFIQHDLCELRSILCTKYIHAPSYKRLRWEKTCKHIFFPNWRQITPTFIESQRLQSLPENRINAHTVTVGPCGPNSSLGVFPAKCFR